MPTASITMVHSSVFVIPATSRMAMLVITLTNVKLNPLAQPIVNVMIPMVLTTANALTVMFSMRTNFVKMLMNAAMVNMTVMPMRTASISPVNS